MLVIINAAIYPIDLFYVHRQNQAQEFAVFNPFNRRLLGKGRGRECVADQKAFENECYEGVRYHGYRVWL